MPKFALTQHDEDLMKLPPRGSYDDTVQQIEGMDEMTDPTVQRASFASGVPMFGTTDAPSLLSVKNIVIAAAAVVGGWWLYKKMRKK